MKKILETTTVVSKGFEFAPSPGVQLAPGQLPNKMSEHFLQADRYNR